MSETDSFIQEVSEEVRRDQLFRLIKKYGWIPVLLVVVLVGGASYNEIRKARAETAAQAFGDGIVTAMSLDDPSERAAALDGVAASGEQSALLSLIAAGEDAVAENKESAILRLRTVTTDTTLPEIYRQIAELKLILLEGDSLSLDERRARLQPLAIPGAPFRLLAEEQLALTDITDGQTDAALERLDAILVDGEATAGLRRRVSQLIVALGGDLDAN